MEVVHFSPSKMVELEIYFTHHHHISPLILVGKSIFGFLCRSATFRNKYSKANVTFEIPWRVGGVVGEGNKNIKHH